MAPRRIKGAIGIAGRVFRAGQEAELEQAASLSGIDLNHPRFVTSLEGGEPVRVPTAPVVGSGLGGGVAETDVVFTAAKPKPRAKPAAKKPAPKKRGK